MQANVTKVTAIAVGMLVEFTFPLVPSDFKNIIIIIMIIIQQDLLLYILFNTSLVIIFTKHLRVIKLTTTTRTSSHIKESLRN